MPRPALLAVVVVNYGSADLVRENVLPLIERLDDALLVVVDNRTDNAERERVRELAAHPSTRVHGVYPDGNTGFGTGMNIGVEAARGLGAREFLLLNPDATLEPDQLAVLRGAVAADPLALVAPLILRPDGSTWFRGSDLYLADGRIRGAARRAQHPGLAVEPWLTGACLLVTDELWTRVGGFSDDYFLYWEDVDLSRKVVEAGGRLRVVEEAVAVHAEGGTQSAGHASAGQAKSGTYYYHNVRNRLLYGARHLDAAALRRWRLLTPVIAYEVLLQGGRRQFAHPVAPVSAAVRGILDGYRLSGGWRAVPSPAPTAVAAAAGSAAAGSAAAGSAAAGSAAAGSATAPPSASASPSAAAAAASAPVASLVVAILTYRRPDDIRAVLPLVAAQAADLREAAEADPTLPRAVRIVVVDNDLAGGAGAAVEDAASVSPVPIAYVHEPTPGISAARNRALDAAGDDDLLVFLDDDERPDPGWLAALVCARRATGSAGVAGPVRSEYEVEPDEWVRAGGFFVRRRPATGTRLEVAATNNLLLDLRAVRVAGLRFDVDLGTQGGEDTLFTRQLVAAGGLLTWCAEAGVVDVVPRARTTRRWVVLRAFSSGNSWSLTSVALAPASPVARTRIRAEATARGLVRALGGTGRIAVGAVTGSVAHRAKGTRTLARGAGMVAGAFGWSYQEYARRD
ncbi:N-acetylglucosaminyl-diphospho-decaprenol L-rhamnosyltransferase [Clavibacter michiganensis]|uniref:N-acetylglucosaminyl-diphospho-decaprenol L-rhamnosyltransferase n=2 Tax=Clavibacter TaxID=1573 RepID=A0A251YWI3_9MICO|nr:glycosyltransferase family 2 protein [Clavibacter michiganensis]OUE28428.1 N-acetylglucosaminyl-diphospho-decaprenol L-rhamnosyltransferase [Clavibacter michiganensis]